MSDFSDIAGIADIAAIERSTIANTGSSETDALARKNSIKGLQISNTIYLEFCSSHNPISRPPTAGPVGLVWTVTPDTVSPRDAPLFILG